MVISEKGKSKRAQEVVATVLRASTQSSFYKNHFSNNAVDEASTFTTLPTLNWDTIIQTPYQERLYCTEGHLAYLVKDRGETGMFARTPQDISLEQLHSKATRPLLAFTTLHTTLIWSLWYYSRNILPLAGEENDTLNALAAKRYNIDALVGDTKTIRSLTPFLEKQIALQNLAEVHVIDTTFDIPFMKKHFGMSKVQLHFARPEVGIIANTQLTDHLILSFEATETVYLESSGDDILCTHTHLLPFPLIRYKLPELPFKSIGLEKEGEIASFAYQI